MVITSSRSEYTFFLSPRFGYDIKAIQLTGFPRFDNLRALQLKQPNNLKQQSILVIRTWRATIPGTHTAVTLHTIVSIPRLLKTHSTISFTTV